MAKRVVSTSTELQLRVQHRVSIGLIAISLSLISMALGTALFASPGAIYLFVPPSVEQQSVPTTATAVTLTWTAPSDTGYAGPVAAYDIRYSAVPITEDNFSQAGQAVNPSLPQEPGSTETYTVTNLEPATTYFFAVKSVDAAGNWSAPSNIVSKTTSTLAAACVPTYSCSDWSACTDGVQRRTCSVTNNCSAGLDAPITEQQCTVETPTVPPVGDAPVRVINKIIVAGLAPGNQPLARIINPITKTATKQITVFNKTDNHGVNVAAGDVTGDHQAKLIVGTGAGSQPLVKVYNTDGKLLNSFKPYPAGGNNGIFLATGDVTGDGVEEIITVPTRSVGQLRIYWYNQTTRKFSTLAQLQLPGRVSAYTLAVADLNGDNKAEIITAPRSGGQNITIYRLVGRTIQKVRQFNPYSTYKFSTGVTIAAGDVFGTGQNMIIVTPGPKYYSTVKVFDIRGRVQTSFVPLGKTYTKGFSLATLDVNNDGRDEIIAAPYQNAVPRLYIYRYNGLKHAFTQIQSYNAFSTRLTTGLRVGGS